MDFSSARATGRSIGGTLEPSRVPVRWLDGFRDEAAAVEHVVAVGRGLEAFQRPLPLVRADPLDALGLVTRRPSEDEHRRRHESDACAEPATGRTGRYRGSPPAPARGSRAVVGNAPLSPSSRPGARGTRHADFHAQILRPSAPGAGPGEVPGHGTEPPGKPRVDRGEPAPLMPAAGARLSAREIEKLAAGPPARGRGQRIGAASGQADRAAPPSSEDGSRVAAGVGESVDGERPPGSGRSRPSSGGLRSREAGRASAGRRAEIGGRRRSLLSSEATDAASRRPVPSVRLPSETGPALVAILTRDSRIGHPAGTLSPESSRRPGLAESPLPPIIRRAFHERIGRDVLSGGHLSILAAPGHTPLDTRAPGREGDAMASSPGTPWAIPSSSGSQGLPGAVEPGGPGARVNSDGPKGSSGPTASGLTGPLASSGDSAPGFSVPDRASGRPASVLEREEAPVSGDGPRGHEAEVQESPAGEAPASGPVVQNIFNVTVHLEGGEANDEEAVVERLTRVLVEQARRQGIDV